MCLLMWVWKWMSDTNFANTFNSKTCLLPWAGFAAWPAVLSRGSQGSRPPQSWWNGLFLSGWGHCLPFPVCCSLPGLSAEARVLFITQHIYQGMCTNWCLGQECIAKRKKKKKRRDLLHCKGQFLSFFHLDMTLKVDWALYRAQELW